MSMLQDLDLAHDDLECVHVVLVGDSTMDNGRYLDIGVGELSVERQLTKRCQEQGWELTMLAQDGSMLEDVLHRQLPLIPERATHIVLSASGNDLLSLLNEMVVANFTVGSVYGAIVQGLQQVSERYRDVMRALRSMGCHLACCTVYRPNFNHIFFKSLAIFSLGLHNSRIKQISQDLDCSVIDLANMFDYREDFANPLELSTRGGAKLVENISSFVAEHPPASMLRCRHKAHHARREDDDGWITSSAFGVPLRCCATRSPLRKIYCSTDVAETSIRPDRDLAAGGNNLGRPLKFSEAQQHWREQT